MRCFIIVLVVELAGVVCFCFAMQNVFFLFFVCFLFFFVLFFFVFFCFFCFFWCFLVFFWYFFWFLFYRFWTGVSPCSLCCFCVNFKKWLDLFIFLTIMKSQSSEQKLLRVAACFMIKSALSRNNATKRKSQLKQTTAWMIATRAGL